MRFTLLILLSLPLAAAAADKTLDPHELKLDQVGPLTPYGKPPPGPFRDGVLYHVQEVGDTWLAIRCTSLDRHLKPRTILVKGVPTKGIVDDQKWMPEGVWKVVDTEKYRGSTVFVLKRAPK